MASTDISWNIISHVFGKEISDELDIPSSLGRGINNLKNSLKLHKPNFLTKNHTSNDRNDGPKPSKTPRISSPSEKMDTKEETPSSSKNTGAKRNATLENLTDLMQEKLEKLADAMIKESEKPSREGILGPQNVKFEVGSHVGSFIINDDRLGVNSQCNFGSIRANTCVFKGKWQYEVQLGSRGVMQIGWATLHTKFTHEKGVGDSIDSYSFDGNRLRKWNKHSAIYGETWQAGDIIGCCIDLDNGTMEFARNGRSLGVAFKDIQRGPGISYFPGVSLAYGENLVCNFGSTPFQYPVKDYLPLQIQSLTEFYRAKIILKWFEKLLDTYPGKTFSPENVPKNRFSDYRTVVVLSHKLIEKLGPHLYSGYVIEKELLPFLSRIIGIPEKIEHDSKIGTTNLKFENSDLVLDILWALLEESEVKNCLERLCVVLLNQFRSNSLSLDYPFQHHSIMCMIALVHHRKTRRHVTRHLLFDRTKFTHFLHVRPVDDSVLKELIGDPWWPGKLPENAKSRKSYNETCLKIRASVNKLERLQVQFLKLLLTNTDGTDKRPSSRALFLKKFRTYIRDVIRLGSVLQQPVNKAMCTFFAFMTTISELYAEEIDSSAAKKLPEIHPNIFFDTSVNFFEMERVGGLSNYLYKTHHTEVANALQIPDYAVSTTAPSRRNEFYEDTPMPSGIRLNPVSQDLTTAQNSQIPEEPNHLDPERSRIGTNSLSEPAIAIAIPRVETIGSNSSHERSVGIIIGPPPPGTIDQASHTPRGLNIHANTPRSVNIQHQISRSARTNDSSGSSSSDDMPVAHRHGPGPVIGTTFFAPGSARFSVIVPMMADFRNVMHPGEAGFAFFPGNIIGSSQFDYRTEIQPNNPAVALLGKENGAMDSKASLTELLDDALMIYFCGVQHQVNKVANLLTSIEEFKSALNKTETMLAERATDLTELDKTELQKSTNIFKSKLEEQARHLAWVESVVYTAQRQQYIYQLLNCLLKTLKSASSLGSLFAFVPEYYIPTLIKLTWLILKNMDSVVPSNNVPGLNETLCQVADFVATHFADPRIVLADTKDTLTQTLSSYICNRTMLTAIENMPSESQKTMIKAILRPYENRAWAQSNWMLVRIWQGNGFGFQYPNCSDARKSYRTKLIQEEFGISANLPPTPSPKLQSHVASVLSEDPKFACAYLNSLLNQLNWSFSEFVGLLQEVQTAAGRSERVVIESRQLKICCTCFELTQALLRVVEMISSLCPNVFTDFTRDSAEAILSRLCMLLCQIINRIGSYTGSFSLVLDLEIPGLENISYYPLLCSAAGILVSLLTPELNGTAENQIKVTKAFLDEPSFQLNAWGFLLGRNPSNVPPGKTIFSLANYVPKDVREEDLNKYVKVLEHMTEWYSRLQSDYKSIADDDVCTICYAYSKNTTFKPCNHRTCKSCIQHHLMNRTECFFCKTPIDLVIHDDGTKIFDSKAQSDSKSVSDDQLAIRRRLP